MKPLSYATLSVYLVALTACAQPPVKPEPVQPRVERAAPKPAPANLPRQSLTDKLLYQFLSAEIAGQRGNVPYAAKTYLELARETKDPRVAQRAAEIALFARMPEQALEAAQIWLRLEPNSEHALQAVAALLVNAGKLDEASGMIAQLLAREGDNIGRGFLHLNGLLAKQKDKAAVLRLVSQLASAYPDLPEAHYAVARAALDANNIPLALQEARKASSLRPGWELGAMLEGQAMQAGDPQQALRFYKDYLEKNPAAKDLRLAYARALVSEQQYEPARQEFTKLENDFPASPEVALAIGLLSMQLKDYDQADAQFRRAIDLKYRDLDAVRLYLGQLEEERNRPEQALSWYGGVGRGEHYLQARVKYANLLAKQGKLKEARAYLQQTEAAGKEQRAQLIVAEAQLLREAKAFDQAYALLNSALSKTPDNPDLLYDRALLAEKLNKLDVAESDLRKLIKLQPDHAHAYNALGYTLADRTNRLDEALVLIQKAISLSPDDPFILDSLGWVQYRMGQFDKALETLRKAYAARPDPEIAAHLGEVLWQQGKRSEAQDVWAESLKDHPDNEALQTVIRKFQTVR